MFKKKKVYYFHPGTYDFTVPFLSNTFSCAICRMEVEIEDPFHVTITVRQDDISNGSITNYFEHAATNAARLFFKPLGILPEYVRWIEFYPAGVVDHEEKRREVVMRWDAKRQVYCHPEWRGLEPEEKRVQDCRV